MRQLHRLLSRRQLVIVHVPTSPIVTMLSYSRDSGGLENSDTIPITEMTDEPISSTATNLNTPALIGLEKAASGKV